MAQTLTPLPHILCEQFCSKKLHMFMEERDVALEDLQTAGYENYWCLRTGNDTGPDDGWVTLERCAPGRECYQPLERSTGFGFRHLSQ
jgi:hypothetical protein